jgi:hypothetical protein
MATRGVYDDALVAPSLALPLAGTPFVPVQAIAKCTVTLTPGSVPADTTAEQDFSVPGVLPGDSILTLPYVFTAGVSITRTRVLSAGTIGVTYLNATASPVTPGAGAATIILIR